MKLQLCRGSRPWVGYESAGELVETYHYHHIPLIGVLRQGDQDYLFHCLAGEIEPVNWWAYTPLGADERQALEDADDFDEAVDEIRPAAIAVAVDGFGIIAWGEFSDWDHGNDLLRHLQSQVREFRGRLQRGFDASEEQGEKVLAAL